MQHRALALALALLLLLAQQLGVQHRASHGLAAAAATAPAGYLLAGAGNGPAAADPAPLDGGPADAQCQLCLLLAALAVAALPALLCWRGLALRGATPPVPAPVRCGAAAGRPYQARAPPR